MMPLYSVALLVAAVFLASVERATSFDLTTANYPTVIRTLADHQNGVTPKRLLRRYDEERAIGVGTISELVTNIKGGASRIADKVVNMKALESQAAKTMKLGNIDDTLSSSNLKNLVEQVEKINSRHIIKISLMGRSPPNTGTTLVKEPRGMRNLHQLLHDNFEHCAAEEVEEWRRKFEILNDYVKLVKSNKSDQALLRTLIKGVGGEDKMGEILYAARTDPRTVEKAKQLQDFLLSKWTRADELPANDHGWLNFYKDVNGAFTADNLNKFMKHVDDVNAMNSTQKKPVIRLYTNSFGDDSVFKKLFSAVNVESTSIAAKRLQTEQLEGWI
ncbi:hypothetical protein L915_20532 [Phytophthora nicotianae]|uniref:RxLR effector protein n=2 Tax=Phytophthora nicotianae TaxID=4792 RepID=W2FNK5_PHYNI|nr:hypothetical protein L915_20532 [Phytophthora nicotianae]ETL25818.1 hypothetical protein L916_20392 [Phytophthora nicotianae]